MIKIVKMVLPSLIHHLQEHHLLEIAEIVSRKLRGTLLVTLPDILQKIVSQRLTVEARDILGDRRPRDAKSATKISGKTAGVPSFRIGILRSPDGKLVFQILLKHIE